MFRKGICAYQLRKIRIFCGCSKEMRAYCRTKKECVWWCDAAWLSRNSEPRRCLSIAGLAILSLVVCLFELWGVAKAT